MKKKSLALSKVYQLIEPGPVVMVTTAYKDESNVMTMSWLTMMEFEPPLIGCVLSNRNYSFELIKKSKECVINIPSVELIQKVVDVGNCSGAKINKFEQFDLTAMQSSKVNVPLIKECYANLECKVVDTRWVNKYNLFVLEVIKAWITSSKKRQHQIHHCGNGVFVIDGKIMKLASKKK